ncbi:MAG TPA: hypothetical protein VK302_14165 [Terriglobales bacterium]|jgi:hypothetical protein|nr:hypothetical protein [Terriglobales bacterium]
MQHLIWWLRVAGAAQVGIILANFVLPHKLGCRENLARVSPMIREVFVVHWIYIVLVVGFFSSLCFWFAPELAEANGLARFLSASMAVFWLLRVPVQLFFYDSEVRRQNRVADVGFLLTFLLLGTVFGSAALGGL